MNCPKYVEFHPKNKFEKLVHLVGLIIRIKIRPYIMLQKVISLKFSMTIQYISNCKFFLWRVYNTSTIENMAEMRNIDIIPDQFI